MMTKLKKFIFLVLGIGTAFAAGNELLPDNISEDDIVLEYNQSSEEFKDKYFIEKASFRNVAKSNPKDKVEVKIGNADGDNFEPKVEIERWDDEISLSYKLIDNEIGEETVETKDGHIVWKKKDLEVHFYDLPASDELMEGGYEFDIRLTKKPKTNKIEFSLNTKGVQFFYQPALTQAEIDDGASRPDNVVGSYAVYTSEPKTNWKDGKEYKVGKVGHIYRPKIYDATGASVWGILSIDKEAGKLTVEIPQEFLDKAVYPIRHAAGLTFGYTTVGGSYWEDYYEDLFGGSLFTGADGTMSKVSIYLESFGNWTTNSKIVVALHSDLSIISVSSVISIPDYEYGWYDRTLTPATSAVDYLLGKISSMDDSGPVAFHYDTGITNQGHISETNSYSSPTTLSGITHSTKKFSIYATYTPSGGAERRIIITE